MSSSSIKKLGEKIRSFQHKREDIPSELLNHLQNYRLSFQKDIDTVFNILSDVSRRIRKDRVVTFRVKRIESILSKLERQPNMKLNTMGDIAGCRCIVNSDTQVIKIVDALKRKFTVKGENNYVKIFKEDGYSAYHLYVLSPVDNKKKIEIQIRSKRCHDWSTLVEILDLVYDSKIKEGEQIVELNEFLKLLSHKGSLNFDQRRRLIEIELRHKIYLKLVQIFLNNYLPIRQSWLGYEENALDNFFVIGVGPNKSPKINSYSNYLEAEKQYFKIFSESEDVNVVLTHIEEVNFNKLCIAYSNYLLVKHSFLNDWREIMQLHIEETFEQGLRNEALLLANDFINSIEEEEKLLTSEIGSVREIIENKNDEHHLAESHKLDEWLIDLEEKFEWCRLRRKEVEDIKLYYKPTFIERIFKKI